MRDFRKVAQGNLYTVSGTIAKIQGVTPRWNLSMRIKGDIISISDGIKDIHYNVDTLSQAREIIDHIPGQTSQCNDINFATTNLQGKQENSSDGHL